MDAMEAITTERRRQVEVEGWTPDHDDEHYDGEMLVAAVIYLWHGTERAASLREDGVPMGWPWSAEWWKPKDRRRNLIRAGALCIAERERMERIAQRSTARSQGRENAKALRGSYMARRVEPFPANTAPADHKLEIVVRELTALGDA